MLENKLAASNSVNRQYDAEINDLQETLADIKQDYTVASHENAALKTELSQK
jgi:hypothetical protein